MILTSIIQVIDALKNSASFMDPVKEVKQRYDSKAFDKLNPMKGIQADKSHGNIMKRAADSVCYYPVIASNAISNDNIRVFSKHLERNVAEMIKIILSNQDVIEVGDKQDAIAAFRGSLNGVKQENAQVVITMMEESGKYMQDICLPMDHGLNENLLTDYMANGIKSLLEDGDMDETKGAGANDKDDKSERDAIDKNKEKADKYRAHDRNAARTSDGDKFQYKANEMAPTVVESEIFYKTPGGGLESTKIIFAVKTIFHPIDSEEIAKEVGQIITTNRVGFDTIKLFTGEISFWRDFVLNANEYKRQMSNKAGPATSMFSALQKHARDNDMAQILEGKKTVPTTTLVLTTDEVEAIRDEFAEDLRNNNVAKRLMEKANLMGIYIMDEAVDTMMMFNVGHGKYDKLSLPKEESKNKQDGQVFKALAAALKN